MANVNLKVENASFSYRKGKTVIKGLNFSASSGDLIAILGPNGAGKTTLLRCIMGFLKWSSGKSTLDGEDIQSIPGRRFWSRVAYVPQARGVFAAYPAEEMILLGRTNRMGIFSVPKAEDLDRVHELMEKMHISRLAGRKCTEMSGGELQMILIARALAAEPELLILDEPESNLDFRNQLIVLDTMSELAANGICCIFNTHYPAHALMRASKALLFCRGGEYLFGETGHVVTEANIEKAFGVKAVIGEVETPGNIYKSIIPLKVTEPGAGMVGHSDGAGRVIAVISLISSNFAAGGRINALLHEYRRYVVGRMGMPYRECGVFILNVTLDGPENEIRSLSHKLGILPGVHGKVTFAEPEGGKAVDEP